MSAARAVLAAAAAAGVTLEVKGDRLLWRAPKPPEEDLLAELRAHKAEVLALLKGAASAAPNPADDAVVRHVLDQASNVRTALAADDVGEDHEAIAAAAALPVPEPPPAEGEDFESLGLRLAAALATPRPWQRITDQTKATAYFRARAKAVLTPLDNLSRGLLVSAAEAEAQRWARAHGKPLDL